VSAPTTGGHEKVQGRSGGTRLRALDGLRGYAALVVLVHHTMLLLPSISAIYDPEGGDPTGFVWLITATPLHLFWAGGEAVYVFFVLSGFVLALPFLRRSPDWVSYYPRRLARLYVPVWGALVLALVAFLAVDRVREQGLGYWVGEHVIDYSVPDFVGDLSLASPGFLNSPFWSLKYEVEFSLALPLFVWVTRRIGRHALVVIPLYLMVTAVGTRLDIGEVVYLPMFGVGALLAALHESRRLVSISPSTSAGWSVFGAGAIGLLTIHWWWSGLSGPVVNAATTLGAALVVVAFVECVGCRHAASSRVGQWLGDRSFSLYLTHAPVLLTTAFVAAAWPRWTAACVGFVLAFAVASAFYRWVESPAHLMSRWLGRRIHARPLTTRPLDILPALAPGAQAGVLRRRWPPRRPSPPGR
jgi:peptidoglycan/LPS O-acetylase OafA/YrhL